MSQVLNTKEVLKEAIETGEISINRGTKGGRPRIVKISEDGLSALLYAEKIQGEKENLIPEDLSYVRFYKHIYKRAARFLKNNGIKGFHELRSTYACRRYKDLTGHWAPCISGYRKASRTADHFAREIIALELGHNRIAVTVSYLGYP
jgi:integrase